MTFISSLCNRKWNIVWKITYSCELFFSPLASSLTSDEKKKLYQKKGLSQDTAGTHQHPNAPTSIKAKEDWRAHHV